MSDFEKYEAVFKLLIWALLGIWTAETIWISYHLLRMFLAPRLQRKFLVAGLRRLWREDSGLVLFELGARA